MEHAKIGVPMIGRPQKHRTQKQQRGVALIAALLTLVLIAAITAGMIILSTTDTNISANFRDEQRAFFSARAGIEEARDRLRTNATNTLRVAGTLPTVLPGGASSVLYILNPANGETVAPWGNNYPDDEICKENTTLACSGGLPTGSGWYTSVTASSTYAASPVLDWKWARVTLKQNNEISGYNVNGSSASTYNTYQACWNGTSEYADATPGCTSPGMPVYVLTSLAVTPGGSRRMIQTEVAEDKLNFTATAALTVDGSGADLFAPGSSNGWGVSGTDLPGGCGATSTVPAVDAIGVTNSGDQTTIDTTINALPGNRATNNYGGAQASPDVANVSSSINPSLLTVAGLNQLVSTIKNNVTQPVVNGPISMSALPSPGTQAAPQIIVVNGDLTISGNTTGYGLLVVTGNLTVTGTVTWNGLILVVGKGVFTSSGTSQYNGALLVAQTVDALGHPLTTVAPGSVNININGGGNGGIQYSSGCLTQATTLSTFHAMVVRELIN